MQTLDLILHKTGNEDLLLVSKMSSLSKKTKKTTTTTKFDDSQVSLKKQVLKERKQMLNVISLPEFVKCKIFLQSLSVVT